VTGILMRAFIQTRGSTADYAFLGAAPASRWWLEFRDATSFEQPTIILVGKNGEWRCYLSGIPSQRKDRVGTAIRYTLILEGGCDQNAEDVLKLLDAWLSDATFGESSRRVQAAMDSVFDEATVERLLAVRDADLKSISEVEKLALEAIKKLPPSSQQRISTESGSWYSSTRSGRGRIELFSNIGELLLGTREGTAALLNLLGTEDEVDRLVEQARSYVPLGVLIEDPSCTQGDAVVPVGKKKPLEAPRPIRSSRRSPSSASWVAIIILMGAILLVIWLLLRNH